MTVKMYSVPLAGVSSQKNSHENADNANSPIGFWDWVETVYNPAEINRTFRAKGWANRLVNGVLHRE